MNIENTLSKLSSWFLNKPKTSGCMFFAFLVIVMVFISLQRYQIIKKNQHKEMSRILNIAKQNIEQSLRNSYAITLTLALTLNDEGVPENFVPVATQLMASNPSIKAVELVPNGVIKYIYPLKGNEAALNANLFKESNAINQEARKTIKYRKMYFAGPARLKQGGLGIVGRLPLSFNNKFWGFSAVVIELNRFLNDAGIKNIKNGKYYFQFSKININTNKEEFFLPVKKNFSNFPYKAVSFPDGDWKLYLIAKAKYDVPFQILYAILFGLLLAAFCGILVAEVLKRPAKDLSESFKLITEQNKRLLNFSYIVSHNLRSHTSNIQAISSLIEVSNSEEERAEMIKLLKIASASLNETLLNLNNVVNIQTNKDIVIENVSLKEYTDKTLIILNDQIAVKKATIINNVPDSIRINYNPAYLESILLNFISNAIRYHHPERRPVVILDCLTEAGKTVLQITDNGIGLDLKKHGEELFGMYKTFNGNIDSKGIGLFISKNQINAMGGTVQVKSTVNIGTCFKIYF